MCARTAFVATFAIATLVLAACGTAPAAAAPNLIEIQSLRLFNEWSNDTVNNRACLVYIHAKWSPKCKIFMADYSKYVANHFGFDGYEVVLMITKLDGAHPTFVNLSRKLGIETFPQLFLFSSEEGKPGEFIAYTGEFEHNDVIEWVSKHIHPKMKRDGVTIKKKYLKYGKK